MTAVFAAALCALPAHAQNSGSGSSAAAPPPIRVYLDCRTCDDDYLKQELTWVEYVRDRTAADVHVLAAGEGIGGGGMLYDINFIGRGEFEGVSDTLQYTHGITDTDDERREGLTETIKLGLLPFVAGRPESRNLRVVYEAPETPRARPAAPQNDPWNAWVFSSNVNGDFNIEDRRENYNFRGGVGAERITRDWKLELDLSGNWRRETRTLNDSTEIENHRDSWDTSTLIVRSVGPHIGVGIEAEASSSTFSNREFYLNFAPAVEYSLFTYDQASRRQVTAKYTVGVSSFDYINETVFGKLEETVTNHSLELAASFRQPWGSAGGSIQGSNYFHDASLRSLRINTNANVRLFRGFSLNVRGEAGWISDQISTEANLSDEDILLGRRQLPTDATYQGSIGFSYTFGSIFSNVVNPRFDAGGGGRFRGF